MKRPHILITNDDGIRATGIAHLYKALATFADITIVAPASEQSGVGLSISLRSSLEIREFPWENGINAWSVTGTPADCVKMGLSVLLKTNPPDLIVSGINRGANHGRSVLYSGTVGGVIEGILRGIPGIAFSSFDLEETEYERFEPYIPKIVAYTLKNPLPAGTMLNVNFPSVKEHDPLKQYGIKLARQGKEYWLECPQTKCGTAYTLGSKLFQCIEDDESDVAWLRLGYITAAPVHVDELTDWRYIHAKKAEFEELFCLGII